MLTDRQRRKLGSARASISADPATYRQREWGNGQPACGSPGCIAGHIVAQDPDAIKRVQAASHGNRSYVLADEATAALELEDLPKLFAGAWPGEWFEAAEANRHGDNPVVPTARHAVAVLDAILDGRITAALDPDPPDDPEA